MQVIKRKKNIMVARLGILNPASPSQGMQGLPLLFSLCYRKKGRIIGVNEARIVIRSPPFVEMVLGICVVRVSRTERWDLRIRRNYCFYCRDFTGC